MARIRSIHPGLFADEAFVSCSPYARLLAIGLWTEADDHGLFDWKPLTLKMRIFPADGVLVDDLLAELETANVVQRIILNGRRYGLVRSFCRYQRPRRPSYRLPIPTEYWNYIGLNPDGSVPNHGSTGSAPVPLPTPPPSKQDDSRQRPESHSPKRLHSRTGTGKSPQRKDEGGRMKEEESNSIDKPVVVLPSFNAESEKSAGRTTTKDSKSDVSEGKTSPSGKIGTSLPSDWTPSEQDCVVAADMGMGEIVLQQQVLEFHRHNTSTGTFSPDWSQTWFRWCSRWREKQPPPPRLEVSANFKPTEAQWDATAKLCAQTGLWSPQFGPDPLSPACRCPPEILSRYNLGVKRREA
jgi:hypothetical protein